MCGIAAIINKKIDSKKDITKMLSAIESRGDTIPNFESLENHILGSVRLKIVDIENGKQPFYNENRNIAVVFNGEIYNYIALKTLLQAKGHIFYSDCDTEVIPHLYEEYGVSFIEKLDGMFAFVLIDINTNSFLLARDRYGIKPLFYCRSKDTFFISSELKSFESLDVELYCELEPGSYFYNNQLSSYFIQDYKISENISVAEAESTIELLLDKAVQKRVQTNLPVGLFLSGGIDSSLVLHLALKHHNNIIPIIIGKDDSEDVVYAKRICEVYNIEYHHLNPTDDEIFSNIENVVKIIETYEPNPVRGSALTYFLAKKAHELGLKIVLCGEGSDEIFAGYGDFTRFKNDIDFQKLTKDLVSDLHRTQLLRIDRIGMAFGVEIREPFMDNELVDYAIKLSPSLKINYINNIYLTKAVLRTAFKGQLPDYILERVKKTLMEGAGADSVEVGKGKFFVHASQNINEVNFNQLKLENQAFILNNLEEGYYFKIFKKWYLKFSKSKIRTTNAKNEL